MLTWINDPLIVFYNSKMVTVNFELKTEYSDAKGEPSSQKKSPFQSKARSFLEPISHRTSLYRIVLRCQLTSRTWREERPNVRERRGKTVRRVLRQWSGKVSILVSCED